ncbi:MAG: hypothetical protein ACI9YT_000576 [Halobacteriales archaeon]|jgi:hypothetical protein
MGETVTAWLVEREFYDENLVSAVYATRDGERYLKRQRSGDALFHNPFTAAVEVDDDDLVPVEDEATAERYAREAERTAAEHDPDDEL